MNFFVFRDSRALVNSESFINGILKLISLGTLESTYSFTLVKSYSFISLICESSDFNLLLEEILTKYRSKKYVKLRNEAIRTQTQPSEPKGGITYITNSQYGNRMSSYLLKGGHSATETEQKLI